VLESLGAAMPGIGFLVGGVISTVGSPRLTFAIAGFGVVAITAVAVLLLRTAWPAEDRRPQPGPDEEIVVELHPGWRIWGNESAP